MIFPSFISFCFHPNKRTPALSTLKKAHLIPKLMVTTAILIFKIILYYVEHLISKSFRKYIILENFRLTRFIKILFEYKSYIRKLLMR